jgi:hypothetical protein
MDPGRLVGMPVTAQGEREEGKKYEDREEEFRANR